MSTPRDFNHVITKSIGTAGSPAAAETPYCLATAAAADATVKYLAIDYVRLEKKRLLEPTLAAATEARRALEASEASEKAAKAAADQAVKKSDDAVKEAAKHAPLLEAAAQEVKTRQQELALAQKALDDATTRLPAEWIQFEAVDAPAWRSEGGYVVKQARFDIAFSPELRSATVTLTKRSADGYALSGSETKSEVASFRAYEAKGFVSPLAVSEFFEARAKRLSATTLAVEAAKQVAAETTSAAAAPAAPKPLPETPGAEAAPTPAPAPPTAFDESVKDAIFQ